MSAEEWRPVPNAPGYEVSSLGRVKSHQAGSPRILSPGVNRDGYENHTLFVGGVAIRRSAHLLVMSAFVGPRPYGMEVRHLDGNPANNALTNLRYGTRSENARDRRQHGTDANANKVVCPAGHRYDDINTYVDPSGFRHCRSCRRATAQRQYARGGAA